MTIVESSPERLVLQSGSMFNKLVHARQGAGACASAAHHSDVGGQADGGRLNDIADVAVATMKDPLSGGELHSALMRLRSGAAPEVPASEREVPETVERVRGSLGLGETAGGEK